MFDNTYFNIRTLDGYDTSHSMGGVRCVTQAIGVKPSSEIERIKTCPPADLLATVNKVHLQRHTIPNTKGIHGITMKGPADIRCLNSKFDSSFNAYVYDSFILVVLLYLKPTTLLARAWR